MRNYYCTYVDSPQTALPSEKDNNCLKGVRHEIFDLHFFHDSNPSRPLINRLKYFRILFRFRRDIRILKKLRGVHPTAESDSAVCIILVKYAELQYPEVFIKAKNTFRTLLSWIKGWVKFFTFTNMYCTYIIRHFSGFFATLDEQNLYHSQQLFVYLLNI